MIKNKRSVGVIFIAVFILLCLPGCKHPDMQTGLSFAKLQPMLEDDNSDCIYLFDDLRTVPGAEELVRHIDSFDFKSAAGTLTNLRADLRANLRAELRKKELTT